MNEAIQTGRILNHPSAGRAQKLAQLRSLARTMDSAILIPGTKIRIGLDGFLGLIPGIGDFAGLAISSYFILVAAQLQVPKVILLRMGFNVLVDSIAGAIPFVGDIFDFVWGANRKNLELLERHITNPRKSEQRSSLFMAGVAIILIATLIALFYVIRWLASVIYALVQGWLPSVT